MKDLKTGEFNASVEWSDHFIKWFGFKNVKMAEEVASAHQEAADEFPDTIKKNAQAYDQDYLYLQSHKLLGLERKR